MSDLVVAEEEIARSYTVLWSALDSMYTILVDLDEVLLRVSQGGLESRELKCAFNEERERIKRIRLEIQNLMLQLKNPPSAFLKQIAALDDEQISL